MISEQNGTVENSDLYYFDKIFPAENLKIFLLLRNESFAISETETTGGRNFYLGGVFISLSKRETSIKNNRSTILRETVR